MKPVRIRVAFEDSHVLGKSQRREGLKRCWVLLRPELDTVAALASHIVHSFGLQDSCPSGLVLSMDQFVIPTFESTGIFKDNDILRVRKRDGGVKVAKFRHDSSLIEDSEIINKQPLCLCDSIARAEEFENESGGYQSEEEKDSRDPVKTVSPETAFGGKMGSKRKRDSNRLVNSRRRKAKLSRSDEHPTVVPEAAGDVHLEHKENHSQDDDMKQERPSVSWRLTDDCLTSKANPGDGKSVVDCISKERHAESQERCKRNAIESNINGSDKKISSRSARRKKAKRQWLRELKNSEKKELIQSVIQEKGTEQKSEVHILDHDNDFEKVVPIVVKPGHIRFEPLDFTLSVDTGQSEQSSVKTVGTPKWSGTVSKRKGQKWGREKNFNCSNDDNALPAQLNVESVVKEVEDNKRDPLTAFEKLFPLTQLPKEGDVLAYRVVELSSSWCPEISSFRVGKVTSYDPTSGKIILMQVPDFPVSFCERDEGSGVQPDEPMYKEDGSLEVVHVENLVDIHPLDKVMNVLMCTFFWRLSFIFYSVQIDFPSLLDVRLFNEYKATMNASISEIEATGSASPVGIKEPGSSSRADHKDSGVVQPTESEGRGGWEEICQALDAKKAELSQEKGWSSWGRKETPTTTKWSYRALRWGALGPTVSLLRSKNDM